MYGEKESFKSLKQIAKASLKGRWAVAIAVTFLNIVLLMLPDVINRQYKVTRFMHLIRENQLFLNYDMYGLSNSIDFIEVPIFWRIFIGIVNFVVVGALYFGVSRFFLNLVRRDNPRIKDLFEGFKILGTTILTNLVLSIFKFLWYALGVVIIALFLILGMMVFKNRNFIENEIGIAILIFAILSLVVICSISIFLNRYALTYYILNDNRNIDVMGAINKSVQLMKGNNIRLFLLYLSFIGWYALGVISLGIGFIWSLPYVQATIANFYHSLR